MRAPRRHSLFALSPLLIALLAACGGGGGGGGDSPNPYGSLFENPSLGTGGSNGGNSGGRTGPGANDPNNFSALFDNASQGGSRNDSGAGINLLGCRYYAAPSPRSGSGEDPLFKTQWHLQNTGSQYRNTTAGIDLNVLPVWQGGLKGQGIRVAIVDDGVELTHDDLFPNMLDGASRNFLTANLNTLPLPCADEDDHGTNVAGIIAARNDNGIGLSGIAPRAGIFGLNPMKTGKADDYLSALSHQADQTHVYNNSWGAKDDGHFHSVDNADAIARLIHSQLATGRKGLGTVYTFAAGNGGHNNDYSAYDGNVTMLGTNAICAVNAQGTRAKYSEPGPNLTVCAPSGDNDEAVARPGIATTALDNKYTAGFNGTSAATPMATGVIALMLEANPDLTWRDVKQVLIRSARKNDPNHAGWTSFGGLNYNHEYGFGLVDADAAVKQARTWQSIGGSSSLKECSAGSKTVAATVPEVQTLYKSQVQSAFSHVDFNKPVAGGLTSQISIPDTGDCQISHIEHVEVKLDVDRPGTVSATRGYGDLQISLTSPSGQTSTLATPRHCINSIGNIVLADTGCNGLDGFTFGISRHMDEPAASGNNRNWTLTVADRVSGASVYLQGWELKLYGR
ncbi:MAG: S8 family serine peptidase [Lautropia sp.]|nr:S8 family serine peptidase [Lautropia sp.]